MLPAIFAGIGFLKAGVLHLAWSTRASAVGRMLQKLVGKVEDEGQLKVASRSQISGWLFLMSTLYIAVGKYCLAALQCTDLPGGGTFLNALPDMSCEDAYWIQAAAYVGIAVYIIGYPLCSFLAILYVRRNNLETDPSYVSGFGILYTKYGTLLGLPPNFCSQIARRPNFAGKETCEVWPLACEGKLVQSLTPIGTRLFSSRARPFFYLSLKWCKPRSHRQCLP